tara:strand:- start:33701 stop:33904 length:204 start_codon:yes stop_codon:yes gene_type:complete
MRLGLASPVRAEAGTMPADDGAGLNEDQGVVPTVEKAMKQNPQATVTVSDLGPRHRPLQDCKLVSES